MSFEKKNITYFSVGFFVFLIFLLFTFNSSRGNVDETFLNSIVKYSSGFSEFSSGSLISIKENESLEGKNILYKNSLLNSVFANISDFKDLNLTIIGNQKRFEIGKGLFLFDINDPSYEYQVNGTGFNAKLLSIGKFFIDSRDEKNIQIMPISSTINLMLMDNKSKFSYTNLYLYPHMNFVFDINRNMYLKNADLYRISSIDKVNYIKSNIYNETGFNKDFSLEFFKGNDNSKYVFFANSMDFLSNLRKNDEKIYNQIETSQTYNIPGVKLIQNYLSFIINNQKKSLYYKNIILDDIKELFVSDSESATQIQNIVSNLTSLREISWEDAAYIEEIIKAFYMQLANHDNTDDYFAEINFYKLISKISSKNLSNDLELFFYLNTFYSSYDSNSYNKGFYTYLNEYINKYLYKNLQINIYDDGSISFKNRNLNKNNEYAKLLDYFSFSLYNIITSSFDLKVNDRGDLLSVVKQYLLINNLIIKTFGDDKRTLAQVYYNHDIAKKILDNFKNLYFTGQRDENKLLILKKENDNINFGIKHFEDLSSIFFTIDKFYKKNYSYLDVNNSTSDRLVDSSYKEINSTYDEYILAAKDYEAYSLRYDENRRNLLDTKTIADNTNSDIILSKVNFINFIKQFNSIDYNQAQIKIVQNHYDIKNIFLAGIPMSFELYPRELNRITSISINGQKFTGSYKLDKIKENYEENYKNAISEEERTQYDFKNFFINTFINKKVVNVDYYDGGNKQVRDEDKAIVILKKDKLLGEKGEFSIISDIFPVKYENIQVQKIGDNYDINISGVLLTFPLDDNGSSQNIMAEFSSKYIFTDTEHRFTKISVKFLDENTFTMTGEKTYLFDAKSFDLPYNLDIKYFADRIKPAIRKLYEKANNK